MADFQQKEETYRGTNYEHEFHSKNLIQGG